MSDDFDLDLNDLDRRMEGAINALRQEFSSLRTGRASATMLDPVMVDAYGALTPINQIGTVNVPEPRMLTLSIWDKGLVKAAEKAIVDSGLGVNPQVDGTLIRLPIPELNEERRRELAKLAGKYAESAKVSIRNVRKDGMDQVKKAKADSSISEDDQKLYGDEIQEMTDKFITRIDEAQSSKEEEIMQV